MIVVGFVVIGMRWIYDYRRSNDRKTDRQSEISEQRTVSAPVFADGFRHLVRKFVGGIAVTAAGRSATEEIASPHTPAFDARRCRRVSSKPPSSPNPPCP
jgi:hypothetical protein